MSFVAVVGLSLPTISAAQPQDLADANAPAVTQTKARQGRVMTPASSVAHEGDKGRRAHTHLQVFVPDEAVPLVGPPFAGLGFETPASLACVYSLVPKKSFCNPNLVTANPTGGFGAIAVVDAFHYPTAATDLQTFSAQFGLRASEPNRGLRERHQACSRSEWRLGTGSSTRSRVGPCDGARCQALFGRGPVGQFD